MYYAFELIADWHGQRTLCLDGNERAPTSETTTTISTKWRGKRAADVLILGNMCVRDVFKLYLTHTAQWFYVPLWSSYSKRSVAFADILLAIQPECDNCSLTQSRWQTNPLYNGSGIRLTMHCQTTENCNRFRYLFGHNGRKAHVQIHSTLK